MSDDVEKVEEDGAAGDEPAERERPLVSETEWTPNYPLIRKLDEWWYRGERLLCGAMFLAMTLLVFAAVVSDIFGTRRSMLDIVVLFGFVYLGVRTRTVKEGEKRLNQAMSVGVAAGITAAVAGLTYLYVKQYPGGFVFAQKLALVMMLWVALLGASMATYERAHLALEMGEKIWPRKLLHWVKAFAHALTSAFCVALFLLSLNLIGFHMDMPTTIKSNLWLAKWQALLIMPYVFGAMSIRLAAQSYTLARKMDKPQQEQLPT